MITSILRDLARIQREAENQGMVLATLISGPSLNRLGGQSRGVFVRVAPVPSLVEWEVFPPGAGLARVLD